MAVTLPNGSIVAVASAYAASKVMSAVSNANPAVATLEASHGVALNEFIEVTSGWSRLNGRIIKAGTPATNDVPLTGINSTSTTTYPAGSGTGSVREISTWQQIAQVLSITTTGGEQQFQNFQFLEDDAEKRIPTTKSAGGLTLIIGNDPSLAGYQLLETANDDRLPRAVRITLPNGTVLVYNCYITLNKTPSMNVNQIMGNEVTMSQLNEPMRY